MRIRVLTGLAAAGLAVTACGGSSPAADWKTGKDVLDSLKEAGFTCEYSGSGEQIESQPFDMAGVSTQLTAVSCNDYVIIVVPSKAAFIEEAQKTADCSDLTVEDVDGNNPPIVLGGTFMILPLSNGEFPGYAQPADFVKAFGGEELTMLDLYSLVCPDAVVPTPSAS